MKRHTLSSFEPVSAIGLLKSLKLVCGSNGVHEGAAMWIIHFFTNKNSFAVLDALLSGDDTGKK